MTDIHRHKPRTGARLAPVAIAFTGMLIAGCQDQLPTATETRQATAVTSSFETVDAAAAGARAALDDAIDRLLPALSDPADARPLANALHGLSEALNNGRASDAPGLTAAIQGAVDRYGRLYPADAADLDAIRLALLPFVAGT